ncbi:MAG: VacB/RNase II family 3'-5' exoribonuclease [Phycisphaerales bacterium]|nr:VacB/RNase II family 3'-5' exoribonuclease [Phycisphaerales bacterium]
MFYRFKRRLIEHLRHEGYVPSRPETLAVDLRIPEQDRTAFEDEIKHMAGEKAVEVISSGHVMLPSLASTGGTVEGSFRKNARGFGFVEPTTPFREGSIFIPAEETADALSGDIVRVQVLRDRRDNRYAGRILEVVERKRSSFSGELAKKGGQWVVYPDGRNLTEPIVVRDAESKNAREGMKVIVEVTVFPESGDDGSTMLAEGVITKVLGEAGRPDVETAAVIAAFNLPGDFPLECVEQAREAAAEYDVQMERYRQEGIAALPIRKDLTEEFILTIDPPDAKDYDDAIGIRRLENGGWELGVHIADVAHFIPPGSALDLEARERANSVYLPRLVIPMLPEVLSNGICSLQEGVHRFCKSAFIRYDRDGNVTAEGVGSTLIRSSKRLTYLEAQALIDGDFEEARRHAKTPPKYTDELLGYLKEMNQLARAIQARRQRQGMITLELPDVVLIFDEQGHVVDAEREDDAFTHTLIEMFMVEANEVLARLFEKLNVPLLRRTHPEPTPGEAEGLRKAAMVAGFKIPKNPTREELQGLVNATRGTPAARAVHMAVLRTLTKAEYSPAMVGHFALASEAYAHFTSPIRRYADLTVHRALAEYLKHTDNGTRRPRGDEDAARLGAKLRESVMCPSEMELAEIGRHATQQEENAEEAERSLRTFLVLQLLEQHIGEVFPGVVTGVSARGLFVQLDKYLADGFVKKEDIPGDVTRENLQPFWVIDQRTGALVDQRSGRSFNMGDAVKIKVIAVDLARRQMECVIADAEGRAAGKAKKPGPFIGGGLGGGGGAGFGAFDSRKMTGGQRRSQKSKARDKRKGNHRRDS